MTHLREQDRRRHRVSSCRKGRHNYGQAQDIGAGIERRVCDTCGDVSIDLTAAHEPEASQARAGRLRSATRRLS